MSTASQKENPSREQELCDLGKASEVTGLSKKQIQNLIQSGYISPELSPIAGGIYIFRRNETRDLDIYARLYKIGYKPREIIYLIREFYPAYLKNMQEIPPMFGQYNSDAKTIESLHTSLLRFLEPSLQEAFQVILEMIATFNRS